MGAGHLEVRGQDRFEIRENRGLLVDLPFAAGQEHEVDRVRSADPVTFGALEQMLWQPVGPCWLSDILLISVVHGFMRQG